MNFDLSVLIADSDMNFLAIAKDKLSARGFQIRTSTNAKDTIKILKEVGCDSLLINIQKEDERVALFEYIKNMDVKPVILYSPVISHSTQLLQL